MLKESSFQNGERVRVIQPSPGAEMGAEAMITNITYNDDGSIKMLIILVDGDPAKTHGTSVFPDQIERSSSASDV